MASLEALSDELILSIFNSTLDLKSAVLLSATNRRLNGIWRHDKERFAKQIISSTIPAHEQAIDLAIAEEHLENNSAFANERPHVQHYGHRLIRNHELATSAATAWAAWLEDCRPDNYRRRLTFTCSHASYYVLRKLVLAYRYPQAQFLRRSMLEVLRNSSRAMLETHGELNAFLGVAASTEERALHGIVRDWNTAAAATKRRSLRQLQWTYDIEALGFMTNPWVRIRCTDAQNLSQSATEARFPYMYWRNESFPDDISHQGNEFSADGKFTSISDLDRSPSSNIQTQWISLPKDEFSDNQSGQTTAGLLIEMPWERKSRVALGCAIAAAWHKSHVRSVRSTTYNAWSISLSSFDFGGYGDSLDAVKTNQPAELDMSWLQLLSIPSTNVDNTTRRLSILDDLLTQSQLGEVAADYRSRP